MKGTSLIVSIVLGLAVLGLYILYFMGHGLNKSGKDNSGSDAAHAGPRIAYVKADSVILNYNLSQDLHDEFTKKQEAFTSEYAQKRQSFERDAASFQEKVQRGGFLTEQRAVQERDRLVGREKEIVQLDQQLSAKLSELQAANNQQILDSLINYLKHYNSGKKYDYILNSGSILTGQESANITAEILAGMNARYAHKVK